MAKRKQEQRSQKETIFIICEGESTEPNYFQSIVNDICDNTKVSVTIEHKKCSKCKLVNHATEVAQERDYDQVWCVFDYDEDTNNTNNKPDFDNAIYKANKKRNVHVVYSNDAFELWFCLHFDNFSLREQHRTKLNTFLKETLSKELEQNSYSRAGKKKEYSKKMYSWLEQSPDACMERAIRRAREQHEIFEKDKTTYHLRNPCTTVYLLVEELRKYQK